MKLSLVIPCYNEESGIAHLATLLKPVLRALRRRYAIELIFVDDGSTDRTAALLRKNFGREKGFVLCRHKTNRNLGAALRTGFARARGDIVACLDSDCTYSPKLLRRMLPLMSGADIVTASPYHPRGKVANVPAYRLFLSRGVSLLYRIATKSSLHTFTAMVRVYRRDVVKKIPVVSDGFIGVTELLVFSLLHGYRVREVPATLRRRRFGESKIRLAQTIKSHMRLLLQIAWMRVNPR